MRQEKKNRKRNAIIFHMIENESDRHLFFVDVVEKIIETNDNIHQLWTECDHRKKGVKTNGQVILVEIEIGCEHTEKKWGINPSEEWEKYGKEILLHNFGKYDKRANTQAHTYWHRTEERIARTIFTLYWLSDALNIYDSIRAKEEKKKAKSRSSVCFFFSFAITMERCALYDTKICVSTAWTEDIQTTAMVVEVKLMSSKKRPTI